MDLMPPGEPGPSPRPASSADLTTIFPKNYLAFARDKLTPERWNHTLDVINNCQALNRDYPLSEKTEKQLLIAALFHDLAKDLPETQQASLATQYRGEPDPIESRIPAIWHGPAAAQLVVEEFNFSPDDQVISAIAYHPTGDEPLSELLGLLIIADYSAVNREFIGAREIRARYGRIPAKKLAFRTLRHKIRHCLQQEKLLHPRTVYAYNDACD